MLPSQVVQEIMLNQITKKSCFTILSKFWLKRGIIMQREKIRDFFFDIILNYVIEKLKSIHTSKKKHTN